MKLKKFLLMFFLLLLMAGLGAYLSSKESTKDSSADSSSKASLFEIPPEALSSIKSISFVSEAHSYRVKKDPGSRSSWSLFEPEGAEVDAELITKLLSQFSQIKPLGELTSADLGSDLSAFGLAPPQGYLRILKDGGEEVYSFGKQNSVTKRRYLQRQNSDKVYIVDNLYFDLFYRSAEDLRDKKPLRFEPANVESIVLQRPEAEPLALLREEGKWYLLRDSKKLEAESSVCDSLLKSLSNLSVARFIDLPEDLALYGLRKPRARVELRMQDGKDLALALGSGVGLENSQSKAPGELIPTLLPYFRLLSSERVYQARQPFPKMYWKPASYFRERTPWKDISPASVLKLEVEENVEGNTVKRVIEGADLQSPENKTLLSNLLKFRVVEFLKPETAVLKRESAPLKIRLSLAGVSQELSLVVGQAIAPDKLSKGSEDAPLWVEVDLPEGASETAIISRETFTSLTGSL